MLTIREYICCYIRVFGHRKWWPLYAVTAWDTIWQCTHNNMPS